jgi:predicted nucleic acid-binding protein
VRIRFVLGFLFVNEDLLEKKNKMFIYYNVLQCNKLNKIIVSDASTLVLLEKIDLLKRVIVKDKILIPEKVYEEVVKKGIEKNAPDAYNIKVYIERKKIEIRNIKNKEKVEKLLKEFNLGQGETEAVVLYLEQKADLLASDDHKAINLCKIYKIPFATAIAITLKYVKEKEIAYEEGRNMIMKLGKYGRYKTEIIAEALNLIGDKK